MGRHAEEQLASAALALAPPLLHPGRTEKEKKAI